MYELKNRNGNYDAASARKRNNRRRSDYDCSTEYFLPENLCRKVFEGHGTENRSQWYELRIVSASAEEESLRLIQAL